MDHDQLVSVIIPTYNRAVSCKTTVESVLAQTYPNVEAVVVDDGSTDHTRETISGIDGRVKYIYQENAGVSAARNRGMEEARGDYVAFLDSDDTWFPWKLEAQLSVLKAFPDAGMVWTDMAAVNAKMEKTHDSYLRSMYGAYRYFQPEIHFRTHRPIETVWESCPAEFLGRKLFVGNIFSWMFMGNLVHTSTVLLRTEWAKKVGFFDTSLIKSGEDYDYHFRTCRLGDVCYIDIPSIHYRVGASDQLSHPEYMIWVARNNLKTLLKMLSVARNEVTLPEHMLQKRMAMAYGWVGMEEFMIDRGSAVSHFVKSLKYDPFQFKVMAFLSLCLMPSIVTRTLFRPNKLIVS